MTVRAEAIEKAARAQRDALCRYWELNGIEHEQEDCPQDDTCDCEIVQQVMRAEEQMRHALALLDPGLPECKTYSPPWFRGRWRDWHRGHGCHLDDGKPRSEQGAAEIAKRGAR